MVCVILFMKKLLMLCFALVFFASFVVAAPSEVRANFIINDDEVVANDDDLSLLEPSFWDSYGNTLIAIIVLIIIYVLFKSFSKKTKKKTKGKSRKRK